MPKRNPPGFMLLDTHVWVWLMEGDRTLSLSVRERIQRGVADCQIGISAISVWEVAMLEAKQRLIFDVDCSVWVTRALAVPGLSLVPLHPEIAIASTRLPGQFHGDPADRIIVATARQRNCTLITADQAILTYANAGWLHAVAAC